MWSTHILYSSTYLFKKRQEHQLVPFFLEVYIEVPFRKNVNGESAFSVSVPAPLWISWEFLAEKFARNSDIMAISEHLFNPFFALSAWWYNTSINDPLVYDKLYPILLTVAPTPYPAYILCIVFRTELIEDVRNISQRPVLKTRRGIRPGNKFPTFNVNPIIVLRFFVEFTHTCRTLRTSRVL